MRQQYAIAARQVRNIYLQISAELIADCYLQIYIGNRRSVIADR